MPRGKRRLALTAATGAMALVAALAAPVQQATAGGNRVQEVQDYCQGQCNDILPPGENGNATLADILANKALGTRPAHTADQLDAYAGLASAYPGMSQSDIGSFFNDSSFGVPGDQVESSTKPRDDVTIVRDKKGGIPHVYGTTRAGTEFGAGYAAAQDRLWVMDLFRHVGRGELTGFAGGAVSNRQLEQSFWQIAPYTEDELQQQIDAIASKGARGEQALADAKEYLKGINAYVDKSYNGRYFPGEYVLTGKIDAITNAGKIEPFKLTDLVALASVIGGLFGGGGGGEVQSALVKQAAEAKFGTAQGDKVWQSFREANDPEAVQTLHDGQSFPYAGPPADPQGVAMPDPGSVTPEQLVFDPTGSAGQSAESGSSKSGSAKKGGARSGAKKGSAKVQAEGVLPGNLLTAHQGMSNALVVSGKYTDDGHPAAVFGPQTGYFAPQLLMLEELQGPGISSRGAAFAGLSFYVELGRGADYAWSATSAEQDITDTYAVPLCTTDGSPATKDSDHYLYHGECTAMESLERDDAWKPTLADTTAAGSYHLIVHRTKYGLVTHRATVDGKPVAFTSMRSTYMHEPDAILGFQMLNDPGVVSSAATFKQAAENIDYAFNWFYVDDKDTAYYNSGDNPARASGVDPGLPVKADQKYEWTGLTPSDQHPQSVNQDYYISWNNKQADDYSSSAFGEGSVHRADLLDDRVKSLVNSGTKVTRVSLVKAMESAAVGDLRGEDVLPELLKVIRGAPVTDPQLEKTVKDLESWQQGGTRRQETSAGSKAYASAGAIRTFDAWWPLLVEGEFRPDLGSDLYGALVKTLQINESPSGGQNGSGGASGGVSGSIPHKGSSFQHGWWSYVDKDLRTVLGETVKGPLEGKYCGGGDLAQCRQMLLTTLKQAAAQPATEVYPGDADCSAGDQWCADSIIQRPLGGVTDPKSTWQNRPTYQQVVQFPAHR